MPFSSVQHEVVTGDGLRLIGDTVTDHPPAVDGGDGNLIPPGEQNITAGTSADTSIWILPTQ